MPSKLSILFLTTFSVLLLSACGDKRKDPLTEDELKVFQACQMDSDCTTVKNGCAVCSCGPFVSINKNLLDDFLDQFDCSFDDEIICAPVLCEALPPNKCIDGLCGFAESVL